MFQSPWLILIAGWALKNLSSGELCVTTQDSPEEKVPSNSLHSELSNTPKTVPAVSGGIVVPPLQYQHHLCGKMMDSNHLSGNSSVVTLLGFLVKRE